MIGVLTFFGTLGGRVVAIAAILGAVSLWRAHDISKQRAIGETRAVAKIEKATDNAAKAGKRAAARAVDPRVRADRDPTTRND